MLTPREAATLLAALIYWREEMSPHGRAIMRPYFEQFDLGSVTPLNRREIDRVASRLRLLAKTS